MISALLISNSKPAQTLKKAEDYGTILYSIYVLQEIEEVLSRQKFSAYISSEDIIGFMARIVRTWEEVSIIQKVTICRDPEDNKLLELILNGNADVLVAGDNDLLVLSPYRGISIITTAMFLAA